MCVSHFCPYKIQVPFARRFFLGFRKLAEKQNMSHELRHETDRLRASIWKTANASRKNEGWAEILYIIYT